MKKQRLLAIFTILVAGAAHGTSYAAPAMQTKAEQAIVADVETNTVLLSKNAYEPMYPASMTKMMTAHVLFDYLKTGKLTKEDTFPVSEKAWRMGGSKMFVKVNTRVNVDDLLKGIVVQSGNDACLVVSEGISGSEEQFATVMNRYAKELGMKQTNFENSTGWPDENHVTSPYDLYLLAKDTIVNYPELYAYYAIKEFTYSGIRQPNRNLLLDRGIGVDGLKTGHTEASGFGITISGVNPEDGRRIIVVVNGLDSEKSRADESERLLLWAYRNFENATLWSANEKIAKADVWFGESSTVPLIVSEDVRMTVPKGDSDNIKMTVTYNGPVTAPVKKGQEIGTLTVKVADREPVTRALLAGADVEKLSGFKRLAPAIRYYMSPN
ncbi:MAG: D-alanyl-D-alanine carboxypeptidase [Alphaproteobacteria bacterium]|nr:D-alanyl-D-alanine carboxypeptidase [Alphaproteobacteria bacterium]